ncbi:Transposon Tf2-1 polyprotein, partial [Trametes pubescens]
MSNAEAEVKTSSKGPPVLCDGKITPSVLNKWELGCMQYFREKEIEDDKMVLRVGGSIANEVVRDWYINDYERYDTMTWDAFLAAIRFRFLPKGWASSIRSQIIGTRQSHDQSFDDFSFELEKLNARLRSTGFRFTDDALRVIMAANVVEDLRLAIEEELIVSLENYVDWKDAVSSADYRRLRMRDLVNRTVNARASASAKAASASKTTTSTTRTIVAGTSSSSRINLPRLTDEEKKLLNDHKGCYKCRRFYQSHTSGACPNGYPDATKYTALTARDASAAKTAKEGGKPKAIAAITDETSPEDEHEHVVAAVSAAPSPLAATTGILGSGSGSDSDDSVSSPFFAKHTTLSASILSPSSLAATFPMLIDSGSAAVLIRRDVVEKTGLRLRTLPEPYRLGNAWGTGQDESKSWVKLKLSLPLSSWESVSCRAIVVDSLCTPVLLGKPFLLANRIVEDHAAGTLVSTLSGFDLLRPPLAEPPPKPITQKERIAARLVLAVEAEEKAQEPVDNARIKHRHFVRELNSRIQLRRISHDAAASDGAAHLVGAVRAGAEARAKALDFAETLEAENVTMKARFKDLFLKDIPHVNQLPTNVYHRFLLKDPNLAIARRQYSCPKKYREVWKQLLDRHIQAGRLRASDSPYASPAFLIPKSDPNALPRWVNDYRVLNANTVPDSHPLPLISEILSDCGNGFIWAKLDMTDSFYQTPVHPDDIKYTAVTTPFGLYEWTVMPQGCRNAPSTHQRRMFSALRPLIGSICHVYLDDIIIWSKSLDEHRHNVELVLQALRDAHLYCSDKKTHLFLTEVDFLGHHISARGVEADPKKIEKILNWPRPRSVADVRAFLGLVRYVANFLPNLAEHTALLTPLTGKDAELEFPEWSPKHQSAFEAIKQLVCSRECLTVIDHQNLGDNRIFVSCDASDLRTGAMLSYGPSLETARPVAFESAQLRAAELNYPVHEKELLAIVRALKKWRVDLLGVPFTVFSDHRTLENFHTQKDLSRRQARWQEFLAQYDFTIKYIRGEDNIAADVLSRADLGDDEVLDVSTCAAVAVIRDATVALRSVLPEPTVVCAATTGCLRVVSDPTWLTSIREGYGRDKYCTRLREQIGSLGIRETNGLLFVGERLVIPRIRDVREALFRCAHDALGHFGFDKSYAALRDAYHWPNMRKELETMYIPSCEDCQRNKGSTSKPSGPLHPLPVPDGRGEAIAIDFVGKLPEDDGFDCIATITDRLGADMRLIPTRVDVTAEEFAVQFFDHWYCENGLPTEIVSDRDRLFVSAFWKALHVLTGVKVKLSTSFHPQTDGASERTNKTMIQSLRYHVQRNQKG